jgi:hypothetical protein
VGASEAEAGLESSVPAIKDALEEKACKRVLQTDTDMPDAAPPGAKAWQAFSGRVKQTPLYFELTIEG